MERLERQQQAWEKLEQANHVTPGIQNNNFVRSLSETEKRELEAWKRNGQLPTQPSGREPFAMGGGYLRYRRVYYGSDANIVAMSAPGNRAAA